MITELSAALSVIKETAGLVKIINESKGKAEIQSATNEINNKLIDLQFKCFSLGELLSSRGEEITHLTAKITEFENFQVQTEGYVLNQLESGAFVYSKKESVSGSTITMHLCPLCFSRNIKSILQPVQVSSDSRFHKSQCLHCKNKYLMDLNPGYKKTPSLSKLNYPWGSGD